MRQNSEPIDYRSLMKNALLEIERLRSKLAAEQSVRTAPIAIVGLSCRFPGADNAEEFWQLLHEGRDAITEVPTDRWDINALYDPDPDAPGKMSTRWGGFLKEIDKFDAAFFRIAPREAAHMDPQQRMLLEVSWEALENAGLAADALIDTPTGVSVGICHSDYLDLFQQTGDLRLIDAYFGTGNALSVAAGRLSYSLGLRGPCLSVETACSASLVAVHLAVQSLRSEECRLALAGGVNLILAPHQTIAFSKAHMLSPDGRCKTFDAAANGYVRGEGCGIVVLKRLSDALRDGDNVLAVIRGSAINQDGKSAGLTAPNGPSQEALIRSALKNAGVEPEQIDYVETHGTGTPLGDPIEVHALANVLAHRRTNEMPLLIGSVKTNIGHLEAAASVAGLIKLVLALQHREIPPHLHYRQLNPHISLNGAPIEIPTRPGEWPMREGKRRLGGLSSFGFSGTNVHVVVEEAPEHREKSPPRQRPLQLLVLSAKSAAGLQQLAERYLKHFAEHPAQSFQDVCYTAAVGRVHHHHRLAVVAETTTEACDLLQAFITGREAVGLVSGQSLPEDLNCHKVAFFSAGQTPSAGSGNHRMYQPRPGLDQGRDVWQKELQRVATLYIQGSELDWCAFYQDASGRRTSLPTYPFARERCWSIPLQSDKISQGVKHLERLPASNERGPTAHPLLGERLRVAVPTYQSQLDHSALAWLHDHRVYELPVIPGSVWLEMALAAGTEQRGGTVGLRDVEFEQILLLASGRQPIVQLTLNQAANELLFEISSLPRDADSRSRWIRHTRGRIIPSQRLLTPASPLSDLRFRIREIVPSETFYQRLRERGLQYGPAFQGIEQLWRRDREALALLQLPQGLEQQSGTYRVHPVLLDAALQLVAAAVPANMLQMADGGTYLPTGLAGLCCHRTLPSRCWAYLSLRQFDADRIDADLRLLEENGQVAVEIAGLRLEAFTANSRFGSVAGNVTESAPGEGTDPQPAEVPVPYRNTLLAVGEEERHALLQCYLRKQLARTLGTTAERLDVNISLLEVGLDSLMALKLVTRMERELGITIGLARFIPGPSIAALTTDLLQEMNPEASALSETR